MPVLKVIIVYTQKKNYYNTKNVEYPLIAITSRWLGVITPVRVLFMDHIDAF